ncbi:ABC transporter permease [Kocuria rhizophila]|uniref:Hypothetical membrane protein n=1 Tax=Kocuria rhizophila (strain ATCC 9341 / DSM 348 / NBRC 103217 / DC2201) TaxID=378753 RepID=B2GK20_KOCRD|nr:ABC transporter permease [Kocuria rhizophila]BAG29865.1 hypothetical membrane protein [Kocuria rhizophila DC2201]VEH74860.1 ABC-type uncharacterized transport system, permease component [Kocuria rhizophila]
METLSALMPSLMGVAVLAAVATTVFVLYRVPRPWAPVSAIARGAVQLAVISVILTGVIGQPMLIATALVMMFLVASTVASRRLGAFAHWWPRVAVCMLAGVLCALVTVFATGALELTARYALAIGAIVIGNCMSSTTLAGRNFLGSVEDHWDEVEGWLALGATPRRATLDLARRAVHDALVPALDQTRTTGLVVLPGAFVGAIFGGVSPLEAGRFQIVVLGAILAAGAVSAALVTLWSGSVPTRPRRPV